MAATAAAAATAPAAATTCAPITSTPTTSAPAPTATCCNGAGVEQFVNRLRKSARHLDRWAKREQVGCYRLYDADLPEYAVAIDRYQDALHVQEYEPPASVDPERADRRLRQLLAALPQTLGVLPANVFVKLRRRQRGGAQVEKLGDRGELREVDEGGHRFLVNLRDYLDTGLFLDHRLVRRMIGDLAAGRHFLNLFAHTATATVYAAKGGAASTTSVDLSNTYLDWARHNLALNRVRLTDSVARCGHCLVRADCLVWIPEQRRRFDLILLSPPTFSNSTGMRGTLDLQRDHVALIQASAGLLSPAGILLFCAPGRRFALDRETLTREQPALLVEEISHSTLPLDFRRSRRMHHVFRMTRR
jgi:23S rRNA (guanine2445-N2)-methyltransferase / 23S rRNA (guanine2069-N7)-methyltransferase